MTFNTTCLQNGMITLLQKFLRPRSHGQFFFDKVGLSQQNMLVYIKFCGEVSLSNICDKD